MGLFNRTKNDVIDSTPAAVTDISGDYAIDASHTRVGFVARHAMVTKVRGQFDEFEGTAHVDTATPANSSVKLVIKSASVSTGNEGRDQHVVGEDFFDVEKYPELTFVSTDVKRAGTDWTITGDLTIKDVTKPVTIEFEETGSAIDPWGNTRIGFEGETSINRNDWGLSWNAALEAGGVLVSEKVKLEFDVSAVAQVPSQA
jgi:polyisoprenoid-binding protein YceI